MRAVHLELQKVVDDTFLSPTVAHAAMSATLETGGEAAATPENTVDATAPQKEPPPETSESIWMRRWILLSFWAVAVFLGLPMWWKTTTVYRAPLPLDQMLEWGDGKVFVVSETFGQNSNNTNSPRSVGPPSRCESPSKLLLYRCKKHSILYGPPNMRSMI
jgi:hypothetical protein